MADLDDLLWEREFRRCRGDGTVDGDLEGFVYFCRKYVTIKHPNGRRLFNLREAQIETVEAFLDNEKVLILKARQIGFTTVVMAFCLWAALFRPDYKVIILNRREKDAVKNLGMAVFAYERLPSKLRARLPLRANKHNQEFKLTNGSEILCYPSNSNPARGDTASLMILDEWAFMPNPEDAWASVEPVTDIGGRLIALSTANGFGNLFHDEWVKAEEGVNDWEQVFFPWSAVPERDQDWYEAKKRSLPEWQLHQEYPTDPESAFIKSGHGVFGSETLQPYLAARAKPDARGRLVGLDGAYGISEFMLDPEGSLSIYEQPQPGKVYVIGADTSEGLDYGDKSSAHVIRADNQMVVAHWHGLCAPDEFAHELMRLGYWYNTALLGPEANNTGLATTIELKRCEYPWVYRRRSIDRRVDQDREQLGWSTNKGSKEPMMADLGAMLRKQDLGLVDGPTIGELVRYQRDENGKMSGSPHDDRVMSLAIAVQMLPFAHEQKDVQVQGPAVRTMASVLKGIQEARRATGKWIIGQEAAYSAMG